MLDSKSMDYSVKRKLGRLRKAEICGVSMMQ
jgi:hypothetical protein